ncbi:MAG TPA: Mur ligase family protein, partial [Chloroflexota bacterium]
MATEAAGLAWLYSLADQERGVGWNPRASPDAQWKLGRTRALLDLAGAPDRQLRIALVAGTKGKGSTCAMLASVLGAAGVRCGLYTKPHLQSYRERVRVDGAAISPSVFGAAVERARGYARQLPDEAGEPTTFEVTTALALEVFAREGCQVGVIEVGLGGRLDATNATDPELSVITSISYDHTAILGRTLGAIASEKAGILRPGRTALLAEQRPTAMRALKRACRALGARCQVIAPMERPLPL